MRVIFLQNFQLNNTGTYYILPIVYYDYCTRYYVKNEKIVLMLKLNNRLKTQTT